VTPTASTDQASLACVEDLWTRVGARIERLNPEDHDRVFAAVSHLPHLLAFALVAMIANRSDAEHQLAHAGAGFRDFTRIAASSPSMWRDICLANGDRLADELRSYRTTLDGLLTMVESGDGDQLLQIFATAAKARRAIAPDASGD